MAIQEAMQNFVPPGIQPGPKGPRVFLDYDKQEIDWAYDQAFWAPNQAEVARRNAQKSEAALARLGAPQREFYGPKPIERLDIYRTRAPRAPINVFIHGGAWRVGDARQAAYMAETYVDAGAIFVSVDFDNVGDVDGDVGVMVDQVRRSVAWVRRNAESFGGDPEKIFISGTSSGAHLTGDRKSTRLNSSH